MHMILRIVGIFKITHSLVVEMAAGRFGFLTYQNRTSCNFNAKQNVLTLFKESGYSERKSLSEKLGELML
jgi:hypothetical protein